MRLLHLFLIFTLGAMLSGAGCGRDPEAEKREKEEKLKTQAAEKVKALFENIGEQAFDKAKEKVDKATLHVLEAIKAEADKYKEFNTQKVPILIEVLETVLIAPDKVNCKTKCKIGDKEIIEVIPVIIVKDTDCIVVLPQTHVKVLRFVVFCNRYEVIVIQYNQKYIVKEYHKKKKKKHHPHGKAHGWKKKHGDDDDDDDDDD
jgi:hypothetical protein